MKKGLRMKFNNYDHCKRFLLTTGYKSIGEAFAKDTFWGTGISLSVTQATNTGA